MPRKTKTATVKKFDDIRKNSARALQIWQILIGAAHSRRTLTYGILRDLLHYEGAGVFDEQLGHIMAWCRLNGLPPLTIIVVNQETGLPGSGLPPRMLHEEREKVFKEDWYAIYPPSEAQLTEAFEQWKAGAVTF